MAGDSCLNEIVTFSSVSTGNITSYEWDFGTDANPATANTAGPHDVTYSSPGTKTVTLEVEGATGSDFFMDDIFINDLPAAFFTFSPTGLTVQFTNSTTNATSYLWDFGDGNTSTQFEPIHNYSSGGTYEVTLTAYNECGEGSYNDELIIVGINETPAAPIQVYPNPSDGQFNITLPANSTLWTYRVTDMYGCTLKSGSAQQNFSIQLADLARQVFILELRSENGLPEYVRLVKN
jgi:PKD repeat protein